MNVFDVAKAWHRMFALHVEFILDGVEVSGVDPQAIGDDRKCELSQWLLGDGLNYANLPAYDELVKDHGHFHRVASHVLIEHAAGRTAVALKVRASSLRSATEAVLKSIDAMACIVLPESGDNGANGQIAESGHRAGSHWRESMRLGEKVLDEQHVELADLIDRLNDIPAAPITSPSFVRTISALDKLTALHCETEEICMQRIAFPPHLMLPHIQEHERLLRLLLQIDLDIMAGKDTAASAVHRQVDSEILSHILDYDAQLTDYITNQGDAESL